jgi:tRNA threonylcarbamoyladenosine biosynthesis protein TsaB
MLTLALDTSGPVGSVALREAGALLAERTLQVGVHHGQALVSEVSRLARDCGKRIRDCDLVAVSIGPGSFTGLRVGAVFAKTMAYAVGCPVSAINSLLAIAVNSPPDVNRVHVANDAQRGELFVEVFQQNAGGDWHSATGVQIVKSAEWVASLEPDAVLSGPGLERLTADLGDRCRQLPSELWIPRAATVAELGELAAQSGSLADPWSLEPAYLRKSSAEEKWETRFRTVTAGHGTHVPQAADRL